MLYGWNDETGVYQTMTHQASVDYQIAKLQSQNQSLRHEMMMQRLNSIRADCVHPVEDRQVKETEDVKKKSPFEIRIDLWNTVNEEIAQVEGFLKNLTLKQPWIAKFFNVQCYRKDRTGFTVDTGRKMELPAALQEKMIRAAEEYLEELKKQREDMERGYE